MEMKIHYYLPVDTHILNSEFKTRNYHQDTNDSLNVVNVREQFSVFELVKTGSVAFVSRSNFRTAEATRLHCGRTAVCDLIGARVEQRDKQHRGQLVWSKILQNGDRRWLRKRERYAFHNFSKAVLGRTDAA